MRMTVMATPAPLTRSVHLDTALVATAAMTASPPPARRAILVAAAPTAAWAVPPAGSTTTCATKRVAPVHVPTMVTTAPMSHVPPTPSARLATVQGATAAHQAFTHAPPVTGQATALTATKAVRTAGSVTPFVTQRATSPPAALTTQTVSQRDMRVRLQPPCPWGASHRGPPSRAIVPPLTRVGRATTEATSSGTPSSRPRTPSAPCESRFAGVPSTPRSPSLPAPAAPPPAWGATMILTCAASRATSASEFLPTPPTSWPSTATGAPLVTFRSWWTTGAGVTCPARTRWCATPSRTTFTN
mmetsp:Transcript_5178/g.16655  ORF Transcript_5178/g.16655 Transcript_5178/m.16655 type:complete len:301 (+) Transcript_5178:2062-2964(+)